MIKKEWSYTSTVPKCLHVVDWDNFTFNFYILLTVHLGTILVNNQLDALFLGIYLFMRVGTLIVATIYLQLIQNRYMF